LNTYLAGDYNQYSTSVRQANSINVPKHLAFIPDGDRGWAQENGLKSWQGHEHGFKLIFNTIAPTAWDYGVHTFTTWLVSPASVEKRPKEQVEHLWRIGEDCITYCTDICEKYDARFCYFGRRDRMPETFFKKVKELDYATVDRERRYLNFGCDYSGVEDIVQAVQKVVEKQDVVSAKTIADNFYLNRTNQPYPDPDLVVRPGLKDVNTCRLSNFMLWQSCYAEFLFPKKYVPEVTVADVGEWMREYARSGRRLGA